jgi:hypothetical protein
VIAVHNRFFLFMLEILPFLATFCTTIFAGAAIYISIAEHPARMLGDTGSALMHWRSKL